METSPEGKELIRKEELYVAHLYNDEAGHCTVGYGYLVHKGPICTGTNITDDDLRNFGYTRAQCLKRELPYINGITKEQAESLLQIEVKEHEISIRHLVLVPLDQSEFDALVDFEYNLGSGALEHSTLLKKLNTGDYEGAQEEFGKWIYANHHKLSGLAVRRATEKDLFARELPRQNIQNTNV